MSAASEIFTELQTGGWPLVQSWIADQKAESVHIEFKGAPLDVLAGGSIHKGYRGGSIAKPMSAFANTDGGVVVFGLDTNKPGNGNPDVLAAAAGQIYLADAEAFAKSLRDLFPALTNPRVPGIQIATVLEPGTTRGAVAMAIPSSEAKPHAVAPGIAEARSYFMRTDASSVRMSHEMLGALFGQSPPSRLRLLGKWIDRGSYPSLQLFLINVGRGSARNPVVRVERMPARQNIHSITTEGLRIPAIDGDCEYLRAAHFDVFHPGFDVRVGELRIEKTLDSVNGRVHLRGGIFAERTAPTYFDREMTFAADEQKVIAGGDDDE